MKTFILIYVITNPFAGADQVPAYEIFSADNMDQCQVLQPLIKEKIAEKHKGMSIVGKCIEFDAE